MMVTESVFSAVLAPGGDCVLDVHRWRSRIKQERGVRRRSYISRLGRRRAEPGGADKSYSLPLLEGLDRPDGAKAPGSEGSLKSSCAVAAKLERAIPGEYDWIAIHGNGDVSYPFNPKLVVQ